MADELFSIDEVAEYLRIPKSTIYKLSQKGELPTVKIGKQLRFRKASLDLWMSSKEAKPQPTTTPLETKSSYNKDKNILLIEDDTLVLKAVARFLKSHGYNMEMAESGEQALSKIRESDFDLIITDIRMPGMDGIETIKHIREYYKKNNKPRCEEIIITGFADSETEKRAEQLGITDYIYKPFATAEFINTIERKLG